MTLRKLLTGLTSVTAICLLAGCGGGSGSDAATGPSAKSTTSAGSEPIQLQVAKCFRANGLPNFPDPVQDKQGKWTFPASAGNPKTPTACEALARQMKQDGGQDRPSEQPLSSAEMVKARAYAKCMREQGVADWPDPNANGYFVLPARLGPPNGMRRFSSQLEACKKDEPTGGARILKGPAQPSQ